MKPTLEQLNELSDYELNCAVAEKLGEPSDCYMRKDYCNNPNDYMPIAIEHRINIEWLKAPDAVMCTAGDYGNICRSINKESDLGRSVCIVFLLMEIDK